MKATKAHLMAMMLRKEMIIMVLKNKRKAIRIILKTFMMMFNPRKRKKMKITKTKKGCLLPPARGGKE